MKKTRLFLAILCLANYSFAQTINLPLKTATIILDNNGNSKADPGDKIQYKTIISNTGGAAANGMKIVMTTDPKTTIVAGSFRSSPVAANDAYPCTGNVGLVVAAANGLKINDFDDNIAGASVTAGTFTTTQNGSITLNADGSFSYNPAAGFVGTDTYSYTLNDGNAVAGITAIDNGTITITVSNVIWFIDNSSVAATSDGRLSSPFKSLANFNAAAGPLAGHLIFIKNTGTNYINGIALKNNQTLFATGHTGGSNLIDVLPFTMAPFSYTLPPINGTKPIITNGGGDGIALASGNTIRGLDIGNCLDFGIDANALNVGDLNINEVSIANSIGAGFRANNGSGTMSVTLTNLSSTGGANGIIVTNCAGSFTVNGGTVTNPTGTGVLISGGSVVFTASFNITDNSGFAVDVDNHDSGNITLSGNITSTATGIRVQNCGGGTITFSGTSKSLNTGANTAVTLASNTGATINFSGGGLVLNSTSATGFNATGGGAITVQGTGNTITATTGTALNVVSTTIGGSGMTFQSISSSGGTNGILLNGSSGNLTVTGDGSNKANGSGGSITNITGGALGNAPVYCLTASGTITLKSMNMSLNTNCYSGMLVDNNAGGNMTANITGCTFTGVTASLIQNKSLLQFEAGAAANVTVNVQNCYFNSSRTYGFYSTGAGTSVMNVTLNQCGFGTNVNLGSAVNNPGTTITNPPAVSAGITNGSSSQVTYLVSNNTFWGANGLLGAIYAVTISGAGTTPSSKLNGTFSGNKIGQTGIVGSGASNGSAGLGLLPGIAGTFQANIVNNDIRQVNTIGINFINSAPSTSGGTSSVKIKGNIIAEPDATGAPLFLRAIVVSPGNSAAGTAMTACAEIGGSIGSEKNTISGAWHAGFFIRVTNNNNTIALRLPGLSPSPGATAAQVNAFVQGNNTLPASSVGTAIGTSGIIGGAICF